MEHTELHSNKTVLKDRILWYDGDYTIPSEMVEQFIVTGSVDGICTDIITPDIQQYNSFVAEKFKIGIKKSLSPLNLDWNIPKEYYDINLSKFFQKKLDKEPYIDEEIDQIRKERIQIELSLFKQHGFINIIYVLIYIINTFYQHDIVWGVGRGSSVSSYLLYLIGVHDVDSILYELDIDDFIHE
jgi:DNA polymerase III alpha subunit